MEDTCQDPDYQVAVWEASNHQLQQTHMLRQRTNESSLAR
jgi:hypothetical protein